MKNKTFYIRIMNLLLIAMILTGYQGMVTVRDRDREIEKLKTEVASYEAFLDEAKELGVVTQDSDTSEQAAAI